MLLMMVVALIRYRSETCRRTTASDMVQAGAGCKACFVLLVGHSALAKPDHSLRPLHFWKHASSAISALF